MDIKIRAASMGMMILRHLLQPFLLDPLQGNRMKCIAGGGTDSRLRGGGFGLGFMLCRAEAARGLVY